MTLPLESQVCSLGLAKKLRDLGVPQESAFYWRHFVAPPRDHFDRWDLYSIQLAEPTSTHDESVAAFTVAEIGQLLPDGFISGKSNSDYVPKYTKAFWCGRVDDYPWEWEDENGYQSLHTTKGDTEADARAKMLIYLIEQKLVTP